jgi:hypothetical protein
VESAATFKLSNNGNQSTVERKAPMRLRNHDYSQCFLPGLKSPKSRDMISPEIVLRCAPSAQCLEGLGLVTDFGQRLTPNIAAWQRVRVRLSMTRRERCLP